MYGALGGAPTAARARAARSAETRSGDRPLHRGGPMSTLAVPLILLSSLAQSPAPAPRELVARAVAAMGGEPAVRGLRGSVIDFYQATFALGQEETPASPARANLTIGRQVTDYAGNRVLFTTESRNPTGAVNTVRRVIASSIGMTETNGVPAPDNPGQVAAIERFIRRTPERLLVTALDNPAALRPLPARRWREAERPYAATRGRDARRARSERVARRRRIPSFADRGSGRPARRGRGAAQRDAHGGNARHTALQIPHQARGPGHQYASSLGSFGWVAGRTCRRRARRDARA